MKDYATDFLGIKKAYVVPNGSDPKQFSPEQRDFLAYKEHPDQFKVLWSGSADYGWQGMKIISEVAERVYTLDKDVIFVLITSKQHLKKYNMFDKNVVVMDQKNTKNFLRISPRPTRGYAFIKTTDGTDGSISHPSSSLITWPADCRSSPQTWARSMR